MNTKSGRGPLAHPGYPALVHAALFLVSALISALGAGIASLVFFLPAATVAHWFLGRTAGANNGRVRQTVEVRR